MAGEVDLIIETLGQNGPASASQLDLTDYKAAMQVKGVKRQLLNLSPGSLPDIGNTVFPTMAKISAELGGNFSRLGAICLYGHSNGAGQTLAFAQALKAQGAPNPVYIGIGDLTMFPFGRIPAVPGVGTLIPKNAPNIDFSLGHILGGRGVPPNAADGDFPKIDVPGLKAVQKQNYFTQQGNRVRWHPATPIASGGGWWWTSTMNSAEIHGVIGGEDWENLPMTTSSSGSPFLTGTGSVDEGHHDSLCGIALPLMMKAAAHQLRNFVLKL